MENTFIVQKLNYKITSDYNMAYKYFTILSILNDLELVKRDLQLLAYSASEKKPINVIKEEFVEKFNTSFATVGNIISKLYKKGVLVKNGREVKILSIFELGWENNFLLQIKLLHDGN